MTNCNSGSTIWKRTRHKNEPTLILFSSNSIFKAFLAMPNKNALSEPLPSNIFRIKD